MKSVRVVDDLAGHAGRQLRLDVRATRRARACATSRMFASGATLMPMNTELLAAEGDAEVVVLGAEHDGGDVLQAHDRAVLLLDRRAA